MKIDSSQVRMGSKHSATQVTEVTESTRTGTGSANANAANNKTANANSPASAWMESARTILSDMARNRSALENNTNSGTNSANSANAAKSIEDQIDAAKNDPKIRLLLLMLRVLTGKDPKIENIQIPSGPAGAAAGAAQPANADNLVYERTTSYTETEQTSFSAQGMIKTADGQSISFKFEMTMARSYHEESFTSITASQQRTKDPLVLNFDGNAAELTDQRFEFDLDGDGKMENINFVSRGSGFLVFDKNGDGKVNDGSELFGAKTGDGFAELAAYDSDRNGWIDENDEIYAKLRIWTRDSSGQDVLLTLKEANVGALFLGRTATPFQIKDDNNQLQGIVRSSGIFLQEDGKVGSMQQIDLTV